MIGVLVDGRYAVVNVLGSGAFGQTFLAKDTKRPGQPYCVIKQLRYASSNPQALQHARRLFKKEAEILEKLGHHDQIPTLLADIEENQEFYLVEQFVLGEPLTREIVPGLPWTETQVLDFLRDVLPVLEFVHSQGVIHRDIKPANLMRRQSDHKIILIDFGAVKELETQIAQQAEIPTIAIGTPGYMAIEQFNGQPQFNSDLYALGMVIIQALLGLPAEALSGLRDSDSTPPGEVKWRDRRPVHAQLANIVDKMVRLDYRQRYQSASAVLWDLQQLQGIGSASAETTLKSTVLARPLPTTQIKQAQPAQPEKAPPTKPQLPQQKRMMAGLTSLVLLVGLAGVGYTQKGRVAEYFYNQGREKARYGDVKGALENYDRAIQIEPNYADAYARRCGTRLRLEDNEGAIEDCNQALKLDPKNAVAYLNWGNIYTEQRQRDQANQNYTRSVELSSQLIQLNSNNEDAYYYRGAARLRLADYRGAIADATQAIQLDSEYADAYVTRCQAQGLLGEHEKATEDCKKATQINPNHYVGFTSLCNNLNNSGKYQQAIDACTRALQINPNDPHAYNNRGVIWFRLGSYQAAIEDYQQAIQRDAQDATAYHNLGDALFVSGSTQAALDAYTKAVEINPMMAAAYYSRGIRQAQLGNMPQAIEDLQHAADLYNQQGRKDGWEDALFQIRKIQETNAIEPIEMPSISEDSALDPTEATTSAPEDSSNPVVDNTGASSEVPIQQSPTASQIEEPPVPTFTPLPLNPPEDAAPVIEEPPAPAIEEPPVSAPLIEEPAAEPYYAPYPPEDSTPESAPVIEEPPLPAPVAPPPETAPVIEEPLPVCVPGSC